MNYINLSGFTRKRRIRCIYDSCCYASESTYRLREHILSIHLVDDKRYKCCNCEKTYSCETNLKFHQRSAHNIFSFVSEHKPIEKVIINIISRFIKKEITLSNEIDLETHIANIIVNDYIKNNKILFYKKKNTRGFTKKPKFLENSNCLHSESLPPE